VAVAAGVRIAIGRVRRLALAPAPARGQSVVDAVADAVMGAVHAMVFARTAAQAIVVVGGGQYHAAPEYAADTVSEATLVHLRYAACLHHETLGLLWYQIKSLDH